MKKIFAAIFSIALVVAQAAGAGPDIPLNGSTFYVPIAQSLAWSAFNQTYVMTPITPSAGVCIFVTNDNPTSSHSFSVSMFQTGNPSLVSYHGFTQFWNPVQIFNSPSSVAANATVSFYANTTAAASIAVIFSGASSAAGSPDTAEIFLVQSDAGTCGSASQAIAVQGTAPNGTAPSGNPVYVAGLDKSHTQVRAIPITNAVSGNDYGLDLGNPGGPSSQFTSVRSFGVNGDAALPAYAYGEQNQATASIFQIGAGPAPTSNAQQPASLFTTTGGVIYSVTGTFTTNTISNLTLGSPGVHEGCEFILLITSSSGTSPTLNVFIQDSVDNATWNDRIAFLQATQSANRTQIAALSPGSINPVVPATNALTAGTVVNGNLGPFLRASYVLGGTSPSFTLTIKATCE